tara:strand:- start:158 stop:793 length:636 start_codon:yes stop_codon:yes gene_type:complete
MKDKRAIYVEAKDLSLEREGRQLFSGVNFQVSSGDILQIEGVNGSGKTSLLRMLAGISRLGYGGQLLTQGKSMASSRSEYSQDLLYIGHKSAIKTSLTPEENLSWSQSLAANQSADITFALAKVGLFGFEQVLCQSLSAGQQRRVALARLYLSLASLWILDEPFTSIDQKGVVALENVFLGHLQRGGALILATHQTLDIDHPVKTLVLGDS